MCTVTFQPTETVQIVSEVGKRFNKAVRIQVERKSAWKPGHSHQNSLTDTTMSCSFYSSCTLDRITRVSLKIIGAWAPP